MVFKLEVRITVSISSHIAEVTNVTSLAVGSTVSLSMWVEVWSGCLASLNQVTKLMNVETVLARGQALNISNDLALLTLSLNEFNNAAHSRSTIWIHDTNSVVSLGVHHLSIFLIIPM